MATPLSSSAGVTPQLPRCVSCGDLPINPKLLPTCKHSACVACVERLVAQSELGGPGPMGFANPIEVRNARARIRCGGCMDRTVSNGCPLCAPPARGDW